MPYQNESTSTLVPSNAFSLLTSSTIEKKDLKRDEHIGFKLKRRSGSKSQSSIYSLSSSTNKLSHTDNFEASVRKYSRYIINLIQSDEYVEGEVSKTEFFLEDLHSKNEYIFRDCFQSAWLELYLQGNPQLIGTFINIASTIDYEWLNDRADVLIFGAYSHKDVYVNDSILRAIESWEQPHHIRYLEQIRPFEISWLEDYRQSVLEFLREI